MGILLACSTFTLTAAVRFLTKSGVPLPIRSLAASLARRPSFFPSALRIYSLGVMVLNERYLGHGAAVCEAARELDDARVAADAIFVARGDLRHELLGFGKAAD